MVISAGFSPSADGRCTEGTFFSLTFFLIFSSSSCVFFPSLGAVCRRQPTRLRVPIAGLLRTLRGPFFPFPFSFPFLSFFPPASSHCPLLILLAPSLSSPPIPHSFPPPRLLDSSLDPPSSPLSPRAELAASASLFFPSPSLPFSSLPFSSLLFPSLLPLACSSLDCTCPGLPLCPVRLGVAGLCAGWGCLGWRGGWSDRAALPLRIAGCWRGVTGYCWTAELPTGCCSASFFPSGPAVVRDRAQV